MIQSGVKKVRKDHRDLSYSGTFGATTQFPDELNLDAGFGFPDQNADGYPMGCTGYTQAEICGDEDKAQYKPAYTYDKTRLMEGTFPDPVGCDIRTSLKSTKVYGVLGINETTDEQAGYHRRGAYFNVVDSPDLDAFDDVRSAILTNNRTVSVATPWFSEWMKPNAGVVPFPTSSPAAYHNWKICGWKQINGQPFLIGKPWCGPFFGDHGYVYFSRTTFNAVMKMSGTGAFTVRHALPSDLQTIKLDIFATALSYLRMWLAALLSGKAPVAPKTAPSEPVAPQTVPTTVPESEPPSKVHIMALAQQQFEGWWPGSNSFVHNNPGNCKDIHGNFLTFKTEAEGFAYLEDYIRRAATGKHPAYPKGGKTSIMEYTHIFTGDPEPAPTNYAKALAQALSVSTATPLSYLLT